MAKSIDTLIEDIYATVQRKDWLTDENLSTFSTSLQLRLIQRFGGGPETTHRPTLRMSRMGKQCPCALWYSIHRPEMGHPIPSWTQIKFTYGDILEALVVALCKGAGHEITGEQDELVLDDIVGHRDCVLDGYTVDIKSANSRQFAKIKYNYQNDVFLSGYHDQLACYTLAAKDDPLVRYKDKAFILAIDQEKGHLALQQVEVDNGRAMELRGRIGYYKSVVAQQVPPPCECRTLPDGASGNIRLDTKASYSPYRYCCHPHLRTFLYASGPVFLTRVVRRPEVPEVDSKGKIVYH